MAPDTRFRDGSRDPRYPWLHSSYFFFTMQLLATNCDTKLCYTFHIYMVWSPLFAINIRNPTENAWYTIYQTSVVSVFFFLLNLNTLLRAGVEPATYGFLAFYIVSLQSTALPTELSMGILAIDCIKMHKNIMVEITEITELKESAHGTNFRQI